MPHLATPENFRLAPTRHEKQASLLRGLRGIAAERETLARNEADLVGWARAEGIIWADIAEALGITPKQARDAEIRRRAR